MDYALNTGGNPYSCFKKLNRDGSNFLDAKMLMEGLQELGIRDMNMEESKRLVNLLDTN